MYTSLVKSFEHIVVHFNHGEILSRPETFETDPELNDVRDLVKADAARLDAFINRIAPEISTTALEPIVKSIRDRWNREQANIHTELSRLSLLKPHPHLRHYYCNGMNALLLEPQYPPPSDPITDESLYDDLRNRGKTHVVLNGYYLDGCVQAHAIDFKKAGFEATIISNLTPLGQSPEYLFEGSSEEEADEDYEDGKINPTFQKTVDLGIGIMPAERFLDIIKPLTALPDLHI